MKIKEFYRGFLRRAGNHFLVHALNILCKTYRIKKSNNGSHDRMLKENENIILGFWHGSMLIPWYTHRHNNFAALVSQSKDGDLLSKVLSKWNYKVIRGSSHTGGKEALKIMIDHASRGYSVAITPDGPTGPPRELKAGIVAAAKKSGRPVILMGVGAEQKWSLESWDNFEIPKPFSRINVVYSDPILIDSGLSYEETSMKIESCNKQLNELQDKAGIFC